MAAERKSDFTGDVFGDWKVTERADALNGKRRWQVVNEGTAEVRIVLQTELKGLAKAAPPSAPIVVSDGDPFVLTDDEAAFLALLVAAEAEGAAILDADGLIPASSPAPPLPPDWAEKAAGPKLPLSGQITAAVLAGNLEALTFQGAALRREAEASTALDGETYSLLDVEPVDPIRVALRHAMSLLGDAMAALDQALKAAIVSGR